MKKLSYFIDTLNSDVSTILVFIMKMFHRNLKSFISQLVERPTGQQRLGTYVETIPHQILNQRMRVIKILLQQQVCLSLIICRKQYDIYTNFNTRDSFDPQTKFQREKLYRNLCRDYFSNISNQTTLDSHTFAHRWRTLFQLISLYG